MKRALLTVFVVMLYPAIASAQRPGGPDVTLAARRITARSIAPGSSALIFVVGVDQTGYDAVFRRWTSVVADANGDGQVELDLDNPLPWKSIVLVADLRNQQYSVVTPAGYPMVAAKRHNGFRRGTNGLTTQLLSPGTLADAVYIPPGGGAWALRTSDGWSTDRDGRPDGTTTIDLGDFQSLVPGADKPREFAPGGILVVVDPMEMEVYAVRLDGSMLGGGR